MIFFTFKLPHKLTTQPTVHFMRKTLFAIIALLLCTSGVYAQKTLTDSRLRSFYTYIYRLNPGEVLNMYRYPNKKIDEKILEAPVDSFKTDSERFWENRLPPGNYMQVRADRNTIQYKRIENHSAFLQMMPNDRDLRLLFLDKTRKAIAGAKVMVNNKNIPFDSKSGLYCTQYSKKDTLVRADYNGVANFYLIKPERNRYYGYRIHWWKAKFNAIFHPNRYGRRPKSSAEKYTGFIIFNKAKYKPSDTVKFKAFILKRGSKRPISAPRLLVRLRENLYDDNGKIVGYVNSYRHGGFEYSFVLSDSLRLSLDDDYYISLEDPSAARYDLDSYDGDNADNVYLSKRKVFLTGRFHYEDYELKSTSFSMRTDKSEHSPGNPLAVYLKATDENDLPVPDGRVILTLTPINISGYQKNHVFVPDTLWVHQLKLDPLGETKVTIPDSIFPDAGLNYNIHAEFLNSSNEEQTADQTETFNTEKYIVTTKLTGDTLATGFRILGKERPMQAVISALTDDDDTISKTKVILPCKLIINPAAASYDIDADSAYNDIDLKDSVSGVSVSGYRTADSLFVNVKNERRLHFWFSVFEGNKLIDEGQADSLFYRHRYTSRKNATFTMNYIWAGKSKKEIGTIPYLEKQLTIDVRQPFSVYPGQRVRTDILVTDPKGKPVPNADVTAWALTRKFTGYSTPVIPYLGRDYPLKKTKIPFTLQDTPDARAIPLDWARWKKEMGLDSIAYYQFTHPTPVYTIEETANDTLTQIAPFVVQNGDILPVHILYIDNRPVYFSQAEQLQRYSFRVRPGKHLLRFRTTHLDIRLDSINIAPRKKLILSISADTAIDKMAAIRKMPDTLVQYEADLINKYMIEMVDNFGLKMAELKQNDQPILLNPSPATGNYGNRHILTGPLAYNNVLFSLRGGQSQWFRAEPDYSYQFEPGLLKQKSISAKYPFNKYLDAAAGAADYTQYVLTQNEADTIWQNYLDMRSHTQQLFTNKLVTDKATGTLTLEFTDSYKIPLPFIKNIILYRYDNPDFIRIYPGNTTEFGALGAGEYRLFFLLKGDSYDIIDSINVKPYGFNYYKLTIRAAHRRDSLSEKIDNTISNRPGPNSDSDGEIENDALRLKEAFNSKYWDESSFRYEMTGTVIGADDKKPIIGCSIGIKGTNKGAVTNIDGKFRLKVPRSGKLVFSFIGYNTQETDIKPGQTILIRLSPSANELQEVVVVGYGTQRKMDMTGSITTVQGRAAGLSILPAGAPGAASMVYITSLANSTGVKPTIIVDGVLVNNMSGIAPADIAELNVLKPSAAAAIYGSTGANGVIIIITKKNTAAMQNPLDTSTENNIHSVRKSFSDYAYWQPKLITDANGKASFVSVFPDDITNWRTFVAAVTDDKQTGFAENQIKSFKPMSAALSLPRFAVVGDQISLIGKVMNYTSTKAKLSRTFSYNGKVLQQDSLDITNSKIDTLSITAEKADSLKFEYTIKRQNGYLDGEIRKIPVDKPGVEETKGIFEALDKDTTLSLNFDPNLGSVTFRAEASVLPALADETEHLREYKYLCNEQLASKLIGLLAEKRIKTYLGKPFEYEKKIKDIIKKLQENRNSQGTWGWWKDTGEELWISLHAIDALTDAKKAGYNVDSMDWQKLTDYLVYQMESYKGTDKLTCLELLRKLKAKVDYTKYSDTIQSEFAKQKKVPAYDKYRYMLLRQQIGQPIVLDSLIKHERHTMFGNIYWGDNNYSFFDNSTQLSLLAYRILKNEGKHDSELSKIRGYLLEQRRSGYWRNTYESSVILETILPELFKGSKQVKSAKLIIKGKNTDTVTKFPYTAKLNPAQLTLSKTGSVPVYITGYQRFWNSNPEKVSKDFTVDTWFEKDGNKLSNLKGGEAVTLKVLVTVKADADYVMIEIPAPAGCSYENKEQSWQNNEVHREYFKDRVNIFCRTLKPGKYEFDVSLMPRYSGNYTLNPAKAEMMYFPVFYGREGMKKVEIGK